MCSKEMLVLLLFICKTIGANGVKEVNNKSLFLYHDANSTRTRINNASEQKTKHLFNEGQDFKVERRPDGKLFIVFNDVFSLQNSTVSPKIENTSNTQRPLVRQKFPEKDFFFPDEIDSEPKCPEDGKSFCTDVQNYPDHQIEVMIKNQISKLDLLFGDDDFPQPLNISQRMSPNEESFCKSVERVIYPKAGESKDLKWMYIINQENYTQAVKIEECINPDKPCMFSETLPNGYVTMCRQNFIFRQLVALTKNGEIIKDNFKLPSCCKCYYKQL